MPGPSFKGRRAASERATVAARGSSKKSDTKHELVLRRALWAAGLRYRKDVRDVPGRPDIVFRAARLVVFCDGDFWHGRNWDARKVKLKGGHNAPYWVAKIERNIARDRERTATLVADGWVVLRFWETDILASVDSIATCVVDAVSVGIATRSTTRLP